jgi:hypothetical protein
MGTHAGAGLAGAAARSTWMIFLMTSKSFIANAGNLKRSKAANVQAENKARRFIEPAGGPL